MVPTSDVPSTGRRTNEVMETPNPIQNDTFHGNWFWFYNPILATSVESGIDIKYKHFPLQSTHPDNVQQEPSIQQGNLIANGVKITGSLISVLLPAYMNRRREERFETSDEEPE